MTHSFSGNQLDRAAIRRLDPSWIEQRWNDDASRFVWFAGDRPLIDIAGNEGILDIRWNRDTGNGAAQDEAVFLGLDPEDRALFGAPLALNGEGEPAAPVPDNAKLIDLRSLAAQGVLSHSDLGILAQARSMLGWHATHRFCATCGAPSVVAEAGYKRQCTSCGREHFPRTDPVVIMVVLHGEDCLLGRGPHFPEGSYSALAGFVEPGESIEEAARREVIEESGVRVGEVRYHSSQPWPFPSSLMIGLIGYAETRELEIDYAELQDARWFPRSEVKEMLEGTHPEGLFTPPPLAIAHHLVTAFVEGET